jgi:hypothetical protein
MQPLHKFRLSPQLHDKRGSNEAPTPWPSPAIPISVFRWFLSSVTMSSLPGAGTPFLSPHIVESCLLERIPSLSFRTRFFSLVRHSSSVSLHCSVDSCYWLQCAEYFAVQEIAMPKFTMVVRIGFYLISSFGLSAVSTRTTTIPESSVAPVPCTFRSYQLLGFRLHTTAFGLQAGGKAGAASCWRYHSGLLGGCMLV